MKAKKWELSLAIALCFVLLLFAIPLETQAGLSDKLVRLHVLANSDSQSDQALKLQVRDAVLAAAQGDEITPELLSTLQKAGQDCVYEQGYDYEVTVELVREHYDTRDYGTFSLPAGYYQSVKVMIGQGAGQNWWCVIFPPLCAGVSQSDLDSIATAAGLTEDEIAFISEDGTGYVIKFKIAELFGALFE